MSRVKYLESKRLIKEFEYIQSDFNYKMELVSEADNQFLKTLNFYLDSNPKLKEIFDQKISSNIDQLFKKKRN